MSAAGTPVVDVLGRERPVARTYEDGSHDCPFCCAAVVTPAERCENPACPASSHASPALAPIFRAQLNKEERDAVDAARRRTDHRLAMERAEADRAARVEDWSKRRDEARRRGACELCATRDMYRPAKYVRHRGPCPRKETR